MTDKITPDELVEELTSPGQRKQKRECLEDIQHIQGQLSGAAYDLTTSSAYGWLNDKEQYTSIIKWCDIIASACDELENEIEAQIDVLDELDKKLH